VSAQGLEQNVGSTDITLSHEELALLDQLAARVVGARY
jgi:aryl-alcohol dehydrogenase-like predicted oxidoreductase